ncbi:MAG: serine/threonine-protein kinase, partial [Planctomycetota bacterium]
MSKSAEYVSDERVLEFLTRAAEDRLEGDLRPLREYLEEFSGAEQAIAQAWLGLFHTLDVESLSVDEERIGPYVRLKELGRGGQGVVWLARDSRLNREVALKTVPRSPLFGELAPRLRREAEALSRVEHPGIGRILDVGSDGGVAWIAMRLEQGQTLAQRMHGPSSPEAATVVLWIAQAARALHAAHEAGVVHRDVKPSNLLVRDDGSVVVLDFGVATSDSDPFGVTLTGLTPGTPGYMAPECLTPDAGKADRRSDVWSLGVCLYQALTGRHPFEAATQAEMSRRVVREQAKPIPDQCAGTLKADELRVVLSAALAREYALRYRTASAFADDLERIAVGAPPLVRRPSVLRSARFWALRHPGWTATLALLAVLIVISLKLLLGNVRQLHDFLRLTDLETARELIDARSELFPISVERADRLGTWLHQCDELVRRRSIHAATLERLPLEESPSWVEPDRTGARWMRSQLVDLLDVLDELEELRPFMAERADLAARLGELIVGEHSALWAGARGRIQSDGRFP